MQSISKWISFTFMLTLILCLSAVTALAANGTLAGKVTISGTSTTIKGAALTVVGTPGAYTATSSNSG
ncbi:MAG: hypothetical protein CXR30_12095, partial [Geobacter sp.]